MHYVVCHHILYSPVFFEHADIVDKNVRLKVRILGGSEGKPVLGSRTDVWNVF